MSGCTFMKTENFLDLKRLAAAALEMQTLADSLLGMLALVKEEHGRFVMVSTVPAGLTDEDRVFAEAVRLVSMQLGVSAEDLLSNRRTDRIAWARFVIFWLVRERSDMTSHRLGELVGGRDHGTVLYGCQQVLARRSVDGLFLAQTDGFLKCLSDLTPGQRGTAKPEVAA